VFDFVEEPLDEIALAIECEVAKPMNKPVRLGRNDGNCTVCCDQFHNGIAVVTLVGQHIACANIFQQWLGLGAVGDIAGCQDQANGIAQRIAQGVEFCGQPAA
jgi:hypothetical protein